MKRKLAVVLGDEEVPVGVLHYEALGGRERSAFAYDETWLQRADRFALEPGLPLVSGPQFRRKPTGGSSFHAAIADTEPDGWGRRVALRDHAKQRQTARRRGEEPRSVALTEIDFLLAVDDEARVGALRFRDEEGVCQRAPEAGRRTVPPLIELGALLGASHAVETQTETQADLACLRGRGTSLGGLRPKCSVVDAEGHLAIGKFPSVADERSITKGEVLALSLARLAGIDAADGRLVESDGIPVALIRRFDRSETGRALYVSAATLLGVEAGAPEEHRYTEIVDALRVHGAHPQRDIEELWRRIAFSILINNVDDHLHNHGFLHERGGLWNLSPAFDLNPFPERARELKTWISEDAGPEASIEALLDVAPYFRLPLARAKVVLRAVETAVARWRKVGKALGMTPAELEAFEEAFEHEERGIAQRAVRGRRAP